MAAVNAPADQPGPSPISGGRARMIIHRALVIVLPPLLSTLPMLAAWLSSGEKDACLRTLERGLICIEAVLVVVSGLAVTGFHLLLVLPALLWIRLRDQQRAAGLMTRWVEIGTGALAIAAWIACFTLPALDPPRVVIWLCGWRPWFTDAFLAALLLRVFPWHHSETAARGSR